MVLEVLHGSDIFFDVIVIPSLAIEVVLQGFIQTPNCLAKLTLACLKGIKDELADNFLCSLVTSGMAHVSFHFGVVIPCQQFCFGIWGSQKLL